MSIDELKNITIGRKDLAALLGYTENHINYLVVKEKAPKNNEHNSYPLIEFLLWHSAYQVKIKNDELKKLREEKPSDRVDRARAERMELELEEKKRNLFPRGEVEKVYLNDHLILISSFDGLLVKIAPQLLGINNLQEMQITLKELGEPYKTQVSNQLLKNGKLDAIGK